MDKIYSRKRLKLPKIYINSFTNRKIDARKIKLLKISLILIIAIFVMFNIIQSINPIIDELCIDESKKKATFISNKEATEVMSNYSYDDMVIIYRDNENNITMLKSNVITINEIISDVAIKIQEELEKDNESKMNVRLRKFDRFKSSSRTWT